MASKKGGYSMNFDKLKEECGVIGVHAGGMADLAPRLYYGLIALQHRGQESAGIVTYDGIKLHVKKNLGLVQEVFDASSIDRLKGYIGVGHVRYSTTGKNKRINAQPLAFSYKGGNIALAHNGNLVNAGELKKELEDDGAIFQTSIDTEVIAHLIAKNSKKGYEDALLKTVRKIKGAFALVITIDDTLIGVRDPHGIRPLVLGRLGLGYVLASETVALDAMGASFVRDIEAGEMIIIEGAEPRSIIYEKADRLAHSSFEYVYFARPDSVIDGKSVYQTRLRAGEILAQNYPVDADIVVPVPDSGRSAAIGYAAVSGIPYGEGLIKNKYVGRTFIQPTQDLREAALKMKLNVLKEIVQDKRVVLIDDSIVRGTTSRKIVQMLKNGGAREVHLRISSPPVKYPSYYGIDTPTTEELVAANMSVDEIRKMIGADSLCFLTVDELVESIGFAKDELCLDVFTGEYPVPIPDKIGKQIFE